MTPKLAAPKIRTGRLKFGWFRVLKASTRNSNIWLSRKLHFFCNDRSTFAKPGPITTFRPEFPKLYGAGSAKALVSKHSAGDLGPVLGFATKDGRSTLIPMIKSIFATSFAEDRFTVNGAPLCTITIPLPVQSPSSRWRQPAEFLANGKS